MTRDACDRIGDHRCNRLHRCAAQEVRGYCFISVPEGWVQTRRYNLFYRQGGQWWQLRGGYKKTGVVDHEIETTLSRREFCYGAGAAPVISVPFVSLSVAGFDEELAELIASLQKLTLLT